MNFFLQEEMKECKEMNVVVIMNGMQKNKALKKRLAKIETNGKEREMKKKIYSKQFLNESELEVCFRELIIDLLESYLVKVFQII